MCVGGAADVCIGGGGGGPGGRGAAGVCVWGRGPGGRTAGALVGAVLPSAPDCYCHAARSA